MKFLIIGDLHGNVPNLHFEDFDAIIAPGDFCSDEVRKYQFQALEERLKNKESEIEWWEIQGKEKAKEMVEKSLSDGREILEKLDSFEVPVYVVPGNWDWTKDEDSKWSFLKKNHFEKLIKNLKNIRNVHNKTSDTDGYQIIGHGITSGPEYPQYEEDLNRLDKDELKDREEKYKENKNKIASLFEKSSKSVVFLTHNVPFNTPLDKIRNEESPRYGYHFGSLIARDMVEEYEPLVCVGGHMHENFGKYKLNNTICINSGFGSDVNTLIKLKGKKIEEIEFYGEANNF